MINPYPQFLWITLWKKCVQNIMICIPIANITKLLKIDRLIFIHYFQLVTLYYKGSRG